MNAPTAWGERCRQLAEPVVEACSVTPAAAGPAALAHAIRKYLPDWPFREVLCRGGWYRLGGVIDADGVRVSDNLEQWAVAELEARDGELGVLLDDYAGSTLRATHLRGRTHYFAAATPGRASTDFVQLEVEALQETWASPLFRDDASPETLDELIDAPCGGEACAGEHRPRCGTPVAAARYRFRRLTHVGDLLARMRTQALEPQPIHRFVADWDASSAGPATAFCNHWAIALREHLDRFRQTIVRATPISALTGEAPRFGAREGTNGLSLHAALLAFDRAVGYPMAWYFGMLAGKAVGHWVPAAVASDAAAGFSYLPERDLAVLRQWLHRPYAF
ncbi:hypothetical protein GPA27_08825 [Aromatoleum toluolicum]|uniref:Uncharacterized protein n=1 Tax=Aromatoleum toluolicum TaxID=90060 RepID=A0ABX1NE99_9RHOO|nr:hypothetical protein [Aromatoleum toluolicum]NMF97490.1 hypothetical protein [Aromatoleum toluolicum]